MENKEVKNENLKNKNNTLSNILIIVFGIVIGAVIFGVIAFSDSKKDTNNNTNDNDNIKNIYHSAWKSASGYTLIIVDPDNDSSLSNPNCNFYIGEEKVGSCIVEFNKDKNNLNITWAKSTSKVEKVTISNTTTKFQINDTTFEFLQNLSKN
ncbi:MAG: hypothetical protein HFI73_07130 [Bacilli bacterium]|nr:hypothetical protein [Bacilli bacterium]